MDSADHLDIVYIDVKNLPPDLCHELAVARRCARADRLPALVLRKVGRPDALVVMSATDFQTLLRLPQA